MKKLSAIFLVLSMVILTASAALAANDLSALSDAELEALRQDVLDEFQRREIGLPEDEDASRQAFTDETTRLMNQVFTFFASWRENDLDGMLALCLPEWQAMCENPRTALFCLLANRTALNTDIVKVEPDDPEDSARTVTVIAEIDRNNGTAPALYRMQIRMVKSTDGLWYVDPKCLVTYENIKENAQAEPTADPAAEVSGETVLYYNPSGGQYYHIDPNCLSVHPSFLPLAGSFRSGELNDEPYISLEPCSVCGAPARPSAGSVPEDTDGAAAEEGNLFRPAADESDFPLYYIPVLGEYYHRDQNCKNVNPKYLPLSGSFMFSELNDEPYVHLKRCNVCGAPLRPEQ